MKNILDFDEFINESLILESFKSLKLAEFKAEFIKGSYLRTLPKGIRWDQISDDEIVGFDEPGFSKKEIGKNDEWTVFWYSPKKQLVKWKEPTYNKWGTKRENSIYMNPGTLLVTRGLKFLHGYSTLSNYNVAEDRYDKPLNGTVAVSKLFDGEFKLNAIAIKWETLLKYSSEGLLKDRAEAKKGALALKNVTDILWENQKRYAAAVVEGKLNRESKPISIRVEAIAQQLRDQIEEAGKLTFNEMVNFKISPYSKDDEMMTAYINRIDYTKVEEVVKKYNELTHAYNYWYGEFKSYISSNSDSYKKWADDRLNDLEKILAKY